MRGAIIANILYKKYQICNDRPRDKKATDMVSDISHLY